MSELQKLNNSQDVKTPFEHVTINSSSCNNDEVLFCHLPPIMRTTDKTKKLSEEGVIN